MNTIAVNSDTPTAATPQPRFGEHALNVAVAAACFASVRRNRPLPQAEAVTVHLFPEAIAAFLGAARVSVGGCREEVGR